MLLGAMNAALRSKSDADPSTMVQLHTLRMLQPAPRTFKDLCAHRKVAPPTLSRSIETLVKRGLVERAPHPDDRRQFVLHLTPAGEREVSALNDGTQAYLAERLKELSPQERDIAKETLDVLMEALNS